MYPLQISSYNFQANIKEPRLSSFHLSLALLHCAESSRAGLGDLLYLGHVWCRDDTDRGGSWSQHRIRERCSFLLPPSECVPWYLLLLCPWRCRLCLAGLLAPRLGFPRLCAGGLPQGSSHPGSSSPPVLIRRCPWC